MTVEEKLTILTDAAKYDVACTSSGGDRRGGRLGKTLPSGCCHTFSADGRCISLLKLLLTNVCIYDCQYCVNRTSHDLPRAMFTPRELADLTIDFYRRNYIEGLFLSSAVVRSPDYTTELLIRTLTLLRADYGFSGYIHAKAIPGADPLLTAQLGRLADRLSVNIELPSARSLALLAPDKRSQDIFQPMAQIRDGIRQAKAEGQRFRHAPAFAPAGQSTQMIVGASGESDYEILKLSQGMYRKYRLKRVFFSAYMPVVSDRTLPPDLPAAPAPGAPAVPVGLAAAVLPLPGGGAPLPGPAHPGPPAGPQVRLGPGPPGPVPGRGKHRRLPHPAPGAGDWGGLRPADPGGPAMAGPGRGRPGQTGGGDEAGPVLPHLLRPDDPGAPGAAGGGAPGPHRPGGPRPGPPV